MSHGEIWDDSVLIDSWNEALQEYKLYHSIQARGENVEEVLQSSEILSKHPEAITGEQHAPQSQTAQPEIEDDRKAFDASMDDPRATARSLGQAEVIPEENKLSAADQTAKLKRKSLPNEGPKIPQHLIGSVHDEGLKSLLMSWYYAGYYTGLYEGQHREK